MIKHYGRYGFPSDPIVNYSIRLIYIALNITWNNLQWLLYFSWMIDNTWAILSMNDHFDIKRQENILCKIPSDSNARNIILYCEFFNAVLGNAIRTFPGMNEKTQSNVFTSGSRRLCTPRPLEINMETGVLFSYCHERPSDINHGMQSFGRSFWVRNINRYVLSTKFLIWSTKTIEVVLVFSENLFTGVTGDTGVNMCLHHARNRIAVQNNALISTIIFT